MSRVAAVVLVLVALSGVFGQHTEDPNPGDSRSIDCCLQDPSKTTPKLGPCVHYEYSVMTLPVDVEIDPLYPWARDCTTLEDFPMPGYTAGELAQLGTAPDAFVINSGALPTGLAFDTVTGVITGTPTTIAAEVSFVIEPLTSGREGVLYTLRISIGPPGVPAGLMFTDTNPKRYQFSGDLTIAAAADESRFDEYVVFLANHNTTRSFTPASVGTEVRDGSSNTYFDKTGSDISVTTATMDWTSSAQALEAPWQYMLGSVASEVSAGKHVVGPFFTVINITDFVSPKSDPAAATFTDTDPTANLVGGVVVITPPDDLLDATHYALQWASETCVPFFLSFICTLTEEDIVDSLGATATFGVTDYLDPDGLVRYPLPPGTDPEDHVQLRVYTKNADGLGSEPVMIDLVDYNPAQVAITASFGANTTALGVPTFNLVLDFDRVIPGVNASTDMAFSSVPSGMDLSLVVSNTTTDNSDPHYTVAVEILPPFIPGDVYLTLLNTFYWDGGLFVFTYDPPQVGLTCDVGASELWTNDNTFVFSATFDRVVTGLVEADFGLVSTLGTPTSVVFAGSGTDYTLSVEVPAASKGNVSVGISDASGSVSPPNQGSDPNPFVVRYDGIDPVVVSTTTWPASPELIGPGSLLTVQVVYDEPGVPTDLSLFGGSASAPPQSSVFDTVVTYNYTLLSTDPDGVIALSFGFADLATNAITTTLTSTGLTFDKTSPTVVTFAAADAPTRIVPETTLTFTLTANEALNLCNLTLFTGTVDEVIVPSTATADPNTVEFEYTVTAADPRGPVGLELSATDLVGNPVVQTTMTDLRTFVVTTEVEILPVGDLFTQGDPFDIYVNFSWPVTDVFTSCSVLTITGDATATVAPALVAGTDSMYSCTITPTKPANVTISAPQDGLAGLTANEAADAVNFVFFIPRTVPFGDDIVVRTESGTVTLPHFVEPTYLFFGDLTWTWAVVRSDDPPVVSGGGTTPSGPNPVVTVPAGTNTTYTLTAEHTTLPLRLYTSWTYNVIVHYPAITVAPALSSGNLFCTIGVPCTLTFRAGGFLDAATLDLVLTLDGVDQPLDVVGISAAPLSLPDTTSVEWTPPETFRDATYSIRAVASSSDRSLQLERAGSGILLSYDDYTYRTSSFLPTCSETCGNGVQTRTVRCVSRNGTDVDLRACGGTPPSTTQACFNGPCTPLFADYFIGDYGSCSAACGGGTQVRPVECRNRTNHVVGNEQCSTPVPSDSLPCNIAACPTYSVSNVTTACSVPCGGGTQTTIRSCIGADGSRGDLVTDCGLSAPDVETVACNTDACTAPYVVTTSTSCVATTTTTSGNTTTTSVVACGGGTRNVTRQCFTAGGAPTTLATCGVSLVEVEEEACADVPCPEDQPPVWDATEFDMSLCTNTSCSSSSLVSRTVTCLQPGTLLEATTCVGSAPNASSLCDTCDFCVDEPCSRRGTCSSGACTCLSGYSGTYCSSDTECPSGLVYTDLDVCCPGVLTMPDAAGDQTCCGTSSSATLAADGSCCASGVVDACGICDGTGAAVDAAGTCCDAGYPLDAGGLCCTHVDGLDQCGVCGGSGESCGVRLTHTGNFSASSSVTVCDDSLTNLLTSTSLAWVDTYETWLEGELGIDGTTDELAVVVYAVRCPDPPNDVEVDFVLTPTGQHPDAANPTTAFSALTGSTLASGVAAGLVGLSPWAVCGNGVCELDERCDAGLSSACCPQDCPYRHADCPVASAKSNLPCNGVGQCLAGGPGGSVCVCPVGYAGEACQLCDPGFADLYNDNRCLPRPTGAAPLFLPDQDSLASPLVGALTLAAGVVLCFVCFVGGVIVYGGGGGGGGGGMGGRAKLHKVHSEKIDVQPKEKKARKSVEADASFDVIPGAAGEAKPDPSAAAEEAGTAILLPGQVLHEVDAKAADGADEEMGSGSMVHPVTPPPTKHGQHLTVVEDLHTPDVVVPEGGTLLREASAEGV